jgi:hypothetical protein
MNPRNRDTKPFHSHAADGALCRDCADRVLELSSLDLGEIATALEDQTNYEHRWLIKPETGESRTGHPTPGSAARHLLTSTNWT